MKELNDKESYQNVVKVLKRSRSLNGISIHQNYEYVTSLITQTFKSNPKIKSIKLERPKQFGYSRHQKMVLSQKIVKGIVNSSVENLEFKNVKLSPDVATSIGKIKTLKSLSIIRHDAYEFDHTALLRDLAKNANQLEALELSYSIKFNEDVGITFFKEKCQTLKKLKLTSVVSGSDFSQELSLCQNLKEVSLNNCHGFQFKSENFYLMPELSKVSIHSCNLTKDISGKYFRQGFKLSHLKSLCMARCFSDIKECENFLAELANQQCPNLERISINGVQQYYRRAEVTESTLSKILQNCPKLKSIKLVDFNTSKLTKEFLFGVYQKRNVYLDVWDNGSRDVTEFERYITSKDDKTCLKYFKMKLNNSSYWKCENCI